MRNSIRTLKILRALVVMSCLVNGLFAGENLYRYVIEVPAWQHLDIATWAEYCRHADLANGVYLFPIEGLLALLLSVALVVLVIRNKAFRPASFLYLTAFFVVAGIALTALAAPQMLLLKDNSLGPGQVQMIFDKFHYWGTWRAAAQILSFITNLIAITQVYRMSIEN